MNRSVCMMLVGVDCEVANCLIFYRRRRVISCSKSAAVISHAPNAVTGLMSPRLIIVRSVDTGTPIAADTSFKRNARRSFLWIELTM